MLLSIYNQLLKILTSEGFSSSYVYATNKHENHLNAQFATINILSNKAVGKAVSSNGKVFEEYELEVKITLYFRNSETTNTAETLIDTLLQRFYQSNDINIISISSKNVCYSSIYKCLKNEVVINLSYLLEEAS